MRNRHYLGRHRMSESEFDHSHDDQDFDPAHPDAQHEQPPAESTEDPADTEPSQGEETDPGDLPGSIPDVPPEKEL